MTARHAHSDAEDEREAVARVSRVYFQNAQVADAPDAAAQPDNQTEGMVS